MSADKPLSLSPKTQLAQLGLSPRKLLGQNFLVGRGVVNMILRAADVVASDAVVEVGPGLGVVTAELVARARRVIAVELDQALAEALARSLASENTLKVVHADAREVDTCQLANGEPYKLVANLPYYAANPILRHFLESDCPPVLVVVMAQREVAKNMTAQPGAMSLLSVGVQLYGQPRIVGYVPPSAFYPQPKVTSALVRIDVYPKPALKLDDREAFFRVVRAGFSAARKQLRNALAGGLGVPANDAVTMLEAAAIDPKRRAETLSLAEWGALYRAAKGAWAYASASPRQD